MGLEKSTSIKLIRPIVYFVLFDMLLYGFIVYINSHQSDIIEMLSDLNKFLAIDIKYQWYSAEPSNVNLYLFAGQIALVVLTGTTISFISSHMRDKYFGFEVREILMYEYTWFNTNFGELVILNFLLLFSAVPAIYLSNSELILIILFIITLAISMKVSYLILCVYFSQEYLLNKSEKIIIHEFNVIIKNKLGNQHDFEDDYKHVEGILNRIAKHSEESIISGNLDMYKENIKLVTSLSTKKNLLAIQNIQNSFLFGSFYKEIGEMLFEYDEPEELRLLLLDDQIINNCNPKYVNINNIQVAEMFSGQYCESVIMNTYIYTKMITKSLEHRGMNLLRDLPSINLIYKRIFIASKNYTNPTYTRMQKTNWSNYWNRLSDLLQSDPDNLLHLLNIILDNIIEDDIQWNIEIVKYILEKNPDSLLLIKDLIFQNPNVDQNKLLTELGIPI